MAIHACFLLVAVTSLFEKLADRNLVLNVDMKELTLVIFAAIVLEPVNADFLLQLRFVRLGVVRVKHLVYRVERRTAILHVRAHAEPGHTLRGIMARMTTILLVSLVSLSPIVTVHAVSASESVLILPVHGSLSASSHLVASAHFRFRFDNLNEQIKLSINQLK